MLAIPLFDVKGTQLGQVDVDPAVFGGEVRPELIKQAIVVHQGRQRQHSARTKGRSDVQGSTRKLYRQKGTGNARVGNIRTGLRRGGGRTFAKRVARATREMPKSMRRLARNSAILAKIQAEEALIVDDLRCTEPKTSAMAAVLVALGATTGSLIATAEHDRNVQLSFRNIPNLDVRPVGDLNAHDVLLRRTLIFTKPAFDRLLQGLPGRDASKAER